MSENVTELQTLGMDLDEIIQSITDETQRVEHITKYLESVQKRFGNIRLPELDPSWTWFNVQEPLSAEHFQGRLTVIDFFTYCCINCIHILPDLEALEKRFPEVLVIGMHSAKFENEKNSKNIKNAIQRYGIQHPAVNDPQAVWWKQLGITCWPTLMVVDPNGHPIRFFSGEGKRRQLLEFMEISTKFYQSQLQNPTRPIPAAAGQIGMETKGSILKYPGKVFHHDGLLFISDTAHHRILVVNFETELVTHTIGCGMRGFEDGSFSEAKFNSPQGICHMGGSIYAIADTDNHALRSVDLKSLRVETLAGNGQQGNDFVGGNFGRDQVLASPWDVCLGSSPFCPEGGDTLYIAMAGTHQIWGYAIRESQWWTGTKEHQGSAFRLAGSGAEENRNNLYPAKAAFAQPSGITYSSENKVLYIADSESSSIRSFSIREKCVKNVCGGSRDPTDLFAFGDIDQSGYDAKFQHPLGIASESNLLLFVADSYNHKIKMISKLNEKSSLSQTVDVELELDEPGGLCIDESGSYLFIADTNNHRIRILDLTTKSVRDLAIKMSSDVTDDAGKVESKQDFVLKECMSASDGIAINLPIDQNSKLNPEAPSMWEMLTKDESIELEEGNSGPITSNPLKLHLKSKNLNEEKRIVIQMKIFLCQDTNGMCYRKNGQCEIVFKN